MKRLGLFLIACLMTLAVLDRAYAISTEQDAIRDITNVFKSPSAAPPNNAVRPNIRINGSGTRITQPFQPDAGPGPEEAPERVALDAYPWAVALVDDGKPPQQGYICAGVLVARDWVLTAAHCTFAWQRRWPVDPEPFVVTGTTALVKPGRKFPVTELVLEPHYNPRTLANDLALLRIDSKGAKLPQPLPLEGPPITNQIGAIAQIIGWGVTNSTLLQRQATEHLQLIQAAVIDPERCFSPGNHPKLRGTGVFCAESVLKYHDTCYRFGGGPILLHDAAGNRYLGGLVSWSAVCPPDVRKPNVYLDVQSYRPWIKSVIGDNAKATP